MKKTKIFIVDDHSLIRLSLRNLISMNNNLQFVGEASDGVSALNLIEKLQPDIVLLDIEMPIMNGFALCEKIKSREVDVKIIFLTMMLEEDLYMHAMDLKADGYLLKENVISELYEAINTVCENKIYHSKGLKHMLIHTKSKLLKDDEISKKIASLTKTEKTILLLVAEKKTTKEIGEILFVSDKTIKVHRHNIITKLKLSQDQSSLLKFALEYRDYFS